MYETWLASVPLLSNLSAYERTNLADALVSETYKDGSWIIRQGEQGEQMYFIEEGAVQISAKNTLGQEVVLNTLKEGDYFGELALILHEPRQASAKAVGTTKLAGKQQSLCNCFLKRSKDSRIAGFALPG
ncbi:hypothetical protein AHF37_10519 [Paragonimus kellicotti]|nr:hypothetical protein AHF37_10519 [Paragonimus kellicotti]